jgi:hypothetical protein
MICFHRGPVSSEETFLYSRKNRYPGIQKAPKGYPEGSQSQLRGASVQRGSQSGLKTVQQLFRGTPLHAKSSKVLRLPTLRGYRFLASVQEFRKDSKCLNIAKIPRVPLNRPYRQINKFDQKR